MALRSISSISIKYIIEKVIKTAENLREFIQNLFLLPSKIVCILFMILNYFCNKTNEIKCLIFVRKFHSRL